MCELIPKLALTPFSQKEIKDTVAEIAT